jgi:hypothetical protein
MREIREIYQKWLEGDLAQEDALFAIGDVLAAIDAVDAAPHEDGWSAAGASDKSESQA